VVHVIAEEVFIPNVTLGEHTHQSRDFH
jgi:hypothetical protein